MEDPTAAIGARAHGAGEVHSARWGTRGGGLAGGRLKPEIKVTIGGDRPLRLGGDVVAFEDMREILVACSEYGQQIDSYHKPRWRRPGAREEAEAGRFSDPNDGG